MLPVQVRPGFEEGAAFHDGGALRYLIYSLHARHDIDPLSSHAMSAVDARMFVCNEYTTYYYCTFLLCEDGCRVVESHRPESRFPVAMPPVERRAEVHIMKARIDTVTPGTVLRCQC